jgi:dipeptidyl aminopeptidase/acylaminoacyl peptidase
MASDPGPDEVPSPDGTLLLGEIGRDLAVRAVVDDRQRLLTEDGVEDDAWNVEGALWSPDSQRVIAVRKDTRECAKLPLVAWLQTEEQVSFHPWTRVGCALPIVTGAVIDVRTREVREVALPGERDQSVVPAGWRHDGREAYFLTTDRRQKYLRLYAVDALAGEPRLVCEETQATFVVGIRQVDRFSPGLLLEDDERLLWYSERDGWRQLYLYRTDGTELGRVTSREFEVLKVLGVDLASETVFFTAQFVYDVQVCRVQLDGTGFRQLTSAPGVHDAVLSPDRKFIVDTHSSLHRPPSTDLLDANGELVMTLSSADVSGLSELRYGDREPFTVAAADGETELYGVMYFPPDFDPGTSYPVIEYQYGGPQVAVHQTTYLDERGLGSLAMAAEGFVVYTFDGRGTPGRGKAFQDVVYGRFHEYHVEDHAHVLRQLLERHPFMDGARVGVTGGSWGGYATVRLLLRAPGLYKVGVAVCPVYDLDDHMATAIEPYMGLPVDRPEVFRAGSSLAIVDRLEGKLLMIHGTSDVNATFSATMKMCEALARADKPYDLVVLPDDDHHFKNAGMHHWRYQNAAKMRYFIEHLESAR